MSDRDALLAGVLANPDADLPRLVYADFVEKAGDAARAEFIRVQCALAAGQFEDDKEKAAMELRERYLREKHGAEWLAPLKKKGEPLFTPRSHGLFRRGFVECVWMPAAWFVAKAEKLFARCPVNELRVTLTTEEEFENLLVSPHFGKLRVVEVADPKLGADVASALERASAAGVLSQLLSLHFRAMYFDEDTQRRMWDAVPQSVSLDLLSQHQLRDRMQRRRRRRAEFDSQSDTADEE